MNQKDLRIIKLHQKGVKKESIARKIGYGGNLAEGIKRVEQSLERIKQYDV